MIMNAFAIQAAKLTHKLITCRHQTDHVALLIINIELTVKETWTLLLFRAVRRLKHGCD